ncbi:hypothetical protein [Streptomyces sp. NPDC051561]|uniref:putative antirestriction adenine methyltransferase n=1 Tax=Streptomyces sp. NPDC051561 TaxID=3365658 RepID=UPI0037B01F31
MSPDRAADPGLTAPLRSIMYEHAGTWPGKDIYVGRSGNFTIERFLHSKFGTERRIHGNGITRDRVVEHATAPAVMGGEGSSPGRGCFRHRRRPGKMTKPPPLPSSLAPQWGSRPPGSA